MEILAVRLVTDVPDWPIVLGVSAGVLLAFELAALLRRLWKAHAIPVAMALSGLVLLPGLLAGVGGWLGGESMAMLAMLSAPLIVAGVAAYSLMINLGNPLQAQGQSPPPAAGGNWGPHLLRDALLGSAVSCLAAILVYHPRGGSVAALAVCAVIWMFRSYSRTTSPLKATWRVALLGLRAVAILLMAIWLAHPGLEYDKEVKIPSAVLIGVDSSASMLRHDMPPKYNQESLAEKDNPVSRIDSVRQAFQKRRGAIQALTENGELNLFTFALKSRPQAIIKIEGDLPDDALNLPEPTEPATALGDSINDAFTPYATDKKQNLAAILMITDGCNNTADVIDPEKEAELMGSRRVPIYTLGVGSDKVIRSTKTLSVKELHSADKVEAFNRLPFTAAVEAIGLEGKKVQVTARFGEAEVEGVETFTPAGKQETHTCQFMHVPLVAGYHRLTVTAKVVGATTETLEGNPAASKLVHVLDRELRVLYVEGKFRYETKYLTQALVAAKRFSIDRRILLQAAGQAATPALTDNPDDWLRYHAIILGDVDAAAFTPKQIEIMKDLVLNKGKGLCMIGGSRSFGRGGWANTPMADVLPIDLSTSGGQAEMLVQVVPTAEGLRNEIMWIGNNEADVTAAWAKMGPLNGCNKLGKTKPAAVVLAETPQHDPLIVTQNYGSGRAVAVAFDTTWQWVLSPKDTSEQQRRFWRQLALYLAAPKGNVWIGTDKTSYEYRRLVAGAETVEVTAGVEDASGLPAPQALKEVTLSGPYPPGTTQPTATQQGKTLPIVLEPRDNVLKGKLPPPTGPGIYVLKIQAELQGKPLRAEHRFEVLERNLENLEVLANFDLLRKMAAASNGRFEPMYNFDSLLRELQKIARPRTETLPVHWDLSHLYRWPIVVILMALFCIEWSIRKRRGLV